MGKKKKKLKHRERTINLILKAVAVTTALIASIAKLIETLK